MNTHIATDKIKSFLIQQLNSLAVDNPMIGFAKPIIVRIINNNDKKVKNFLSMIADESGDIDMKSLVPEMFDSLMASKSFVYKTDFIGDLEIGEGKIKMNLPMTTKQIVLQREDLEKLKTILLEDGD